MKSDDLTVGLLDLLQLTEVVPVTGLGNNVVGRKNPHAARIVSTIANGRKSLLE